jgi:hypothetical protein
MGVIVYVGVTVIVAVTLGVTVSVGGVPDGVIVGVTTGALSQ